MKISVVCPSVGAAACRSGRCVAWRRAAVRPRVLWWLLFVVAVLYVFWPRNTDIRSFDPAAAARLETRAWKHYYERNYLRLGTDLYGLARGEMRASPAHSVQIVWHAARAAHVFQRSNSREQALLALPHVRRYYAAVAAASDEPFDVENAAELELEWWQQRREHVPPEAYAKVIADNSTVFYGVRNADTERAALLRAQAMAYRDARRNGLMQAEDWQHVQDILLEGYTHLLAGVSGQGTPAVVAPVQVLEQASEQPQERVLQEGAQKAQP